MHGFSFFCYGKQSQTWLAGHLYHLLSARRNFFLMENSRQNFPCIHQHLEFISFTVLQRLCMLLHIALHDRFWAGNTQTWEKFAHIFILGYQWEHCWHLILFTFLFILNSSCHFFKVFTLVTLLAATSMIHGFFLLTQNLNKSVKGIQSIRIILQYVCISLRLIINVYIILALKLKSCHMTYTFWKRIILKLINKNSLLFLQK